MSLALFLCANSLRVKATGHSVSQGRTGANDKAYEQLGVRDDAAAARAQALGVKVVKDRCLKIEYERLAIRNA